VCIDIDGSNQELSISGDNGVYNFYYFDDVASSCGYDGAGNPIAAYGTGTGAGTANENVLTTELSFWCLSEPETFLATVLGEVTYDASGDTLTMSSDGWSPSIWSRR